MKVRINIADNEQLKQTDLDFFFIYDNNTEFLYSINLHSHTFEEWLIFIDGEEYYRELNEFMCIENDTLIIQLHTPSLKYTYNFMFSVPFYLIKEELKDTILNANKRGFFNVK